MAGSSSDVLNYISASSFAKFKVSKAYSGKIYDLVISSNKMNDDQYLNEIFKTVENFNSK